MMELDPNEVNRLAKKYLEGLASEEEKKLLHDWYDNINDSETELVITNEPKTNDTVGAEMLAELRKMIASEEEAQAETKIHKIKWYRVAAAAAVIIALGSVAWFTLRTNSEKHIATVTHVEQQEVTAPQRARAVITLANGQHIYLDSAAKGSLATQGNSRLVKVSDRQVAYVGIPDTHEVIYNVLTVPRGSRIVSLTLSDGTVVWLNAESSLRYPVVFNGPDRTVEVTGEAYFEVAKDPTRKFFVKSSSLTTEVLGTHFNVNTYDDEASMKVTLLEGSIRVAAKDNVHAVRLRPGQQAEVSGPSDVRILENVDIEEVMAWKNEYFMMKGTSLASLMRQMARWYDVEIVIKGNLSDKKFGGAISRNVNLPTMLEALKQNGVNSQTNGRIVTIY
jgi:ferric-dicitrate binding protein FerR (iron transport regulator)